MSYRQLTTTEQLKLYQYRTTDKLTMKEIADPDEVLYFQTSKIVVLPI